MAYIFTDGATALYRTATAERPMPRDHYPVTMTVDMMVTTLSGGGVRKWPVALSESTTTAIIGPCHEDGGTWEIECWANTGLGVSWISVEPNSPMGTNGARWKWLRYMATFERIWTSLGTSYEGQQGYLGILGRGGANGVSGIMHKGGLSNGGTSFDSFNIGGAKTTGSTQTRYVLANTLLANAAIWRKQLDLQTCMELMRGRHPMQLPSGSLPDEFYPLEVDEGAEPRCIVSGNKMQVDGTGYAFASTANIPANGYVSRHPTTLSAPLWARGGLAEVAAAVYSAPSEPPPVVEVNYSASSKSLTGVFEALGQSSEVVVDRPCVYQLDGFGTATVVIEGNLGDGWVVLRIARDTANASFTADRIGIIGQRGVNMRVRFNCTAYTSGTISYRLTRAD